MQYRDVWNGLVCVPFRIQILARVSRLWISSVRHNLASDLSEQRNHAAHEDAIGVVKRQGVPRGQGAIEDSARSSRDEQLCTVRVA